MGFVDPSARRSTTRRSSRLDCWIAERRTRVDAFTKLEAADGGIGYAGEYRDTTGLINLRFRSYDPVLGRFIGRDTFGGVLSAPQTGNRYAYAVSNPLRYTDPSGHFVNAAITVAPTLLEVALTVNPVGATLVFGHQLITGTDPATGARIDPREAVLGLAVTFGPIAAAKALGSLFLTR